MPIMMPMSVLSRYIDLASTLHTVTRKAYSRSAFHVLLHKRLDELIDSLGPMRRVVIAMDGPAPLAKLLEQRRRRKKEADKTMDEESVDVIPVKIQHSGKKHRKGSPHRVSSLFLTTGTLFMLEVHNSLLCYILKRLSDPKYSHIEYEFSDSTVKGEGELKIMSRLLQNKDDSETHAVVGADSDLLLMTMIASKPNVYVVDDLPKRKFPPGQKQRHHHKMFNSNKLAEIWRHSLLENDPAREDTSSLARDLTIIAILCSGNDYLPGCQGLTLKDYMRPGLWNLYLDMRRQPEWFGQSLTNVVPLDRKDTSLNNKTKTKAFELPDFKIKINGLMLGALLQRHVDQKIISTQKKKKFTNIEGNWAYGMENFDSKRASTSLSNSQTTQNFMRKPPDCASYIKGIEWTLNMYSTGSVDDYRFSYPAAPPSITSLVSYLEQKASLNNEDVQDLQPSERDMSFKEKAALQPLLPAACALALLPARSRNQAATAVRHLMDADSPVAEIYAVCKECQRLARSIREANAELEEVRRQLSGLQDKLSEVGLDSESALEADSELAAALERWEAAADPLRDLLRDLSRSHHKHLMESHPYKPFPTEDLEDAVLAIPTALYPFWERQLTRFGRELVYKSRRDEPATSGAPEDEQQLEEEGDPQWMRECLRFANAYPKVAQVDDLRQSANRVERTVLPLYPYMQPGGSIRLPPRRSFASHSRPKLGMAAFRGSFIRPAVGSSNKYLTDECRTTSTTGIVSSLPSMSMIKNVAAGPRRSIFLSRYAKVLRPSLGFLRKVIT